MYNYVALLQRCTAYMMPGYRRCRPMYISCAALLRCSYTVPYKYGYLFWHVRGIICQSAKRR